MIAINSMTFSRYPHFFFEGGGGVSLFEEVSVCVKGVQQWVIDIDREGLIPFLFL